MRSSDYVEEGVVGRAPAKRRGGLKNSGGAEMTIEARARRTRRYMAWRFDTVAALEQTTGRRATFRERVDRYADAIHSSRHGN